MRGNRRSLAQKLGLSPGLVVQELGWDTDADDDVRVMIEDAIDGEMVEDAMEAVDLVLLWWRDEDGDLVDGLMEALTDLTGTGYIWLMTPKVGRGGYVDAADLAEAAVTAGLALTTSAGSRPTGRPPSWSGPGARAGDRRSDRPGPGLPSPATSTASRSPWPLCGGRRW